MADREYVFYWAGVIMSGITGVATIAAYNYYHAESEARCNTACHPYQYQVVDDGCYCSTEEGNLELQFEDAE